nr:hypothetical protein [Tanacetum cinerariifolium]
DDGKKVDEDPRQESECKDQENEDNVNSTNNVNAAGTNEVNVVGANTRNELPFDPKMSKLEDISTFTFSYEDEDDDKRAIMIRNKARLVAQEHTQEKGMYYDELFSLVARIKAIRLCLDYSSFKDFVVYQMDVKSAFLYGKIEEEKELCNAFEKMMHEKFQMSSIEELTFFLGLQVKQKQDGIFISQDKYVAEILKKCGFLEVKNASTPMETQKPLLKDEDEKEVDVHMYRSMITSLMYLTSLRPDILFIVCACIRYQVNPKLSHLHAVKRIFRYLKGHHKLGLWYPKDSFFDLKAYTDSDYVGSSLDKKYTTRGCQYLGCRLISWQCKKQTIVANSTTEAEYVTASSCCRQAKTVNGDVQLQALVDGKNVIITESTIRRDLQLKDVKSVDCLPSGAIFEQLTQMGTMASVIICLATNQKFNFSKYIFKSMVKNLDNVNKFLMYPRAGKYFSGRETPLFLTMMVQAPKEIGSCSVNPNDPHHIPIIIQPSTSQPQRTQKFRKTKRKDIELPQTSVPTSVDRGNIFKTQSKETPNEPGSQGTSSGGGPRCQETMGDVVAQTRSERVSKISNDPLLARFNTSQSDEDSLKLNELMELCTNLQNKVLDLETTKTTQAMEIEILKRRVKKLENKQRLRTHKLKRLYKDGLSARVESSEDKGLGKEDTSKHGRISDINADDDITLASTHDEQMFDADQDLHGEEVFVAQQDENVIEKEADVTQVQVTTTATTPKILIDKATLAQALTELKHAKPKTKAKGIVLDEIEESTTTTTTAIPKPKSHVKDKGKAKMIEEPVKLKNKDQIQLDEEVALRLQEELQAEFVTPLNWVAAEYETGACYFIDQ